MDEVFRIGREAGVAVHISHFNSRADLALPKLDAGRAEGIDATYDLYCYLAGNTILGMIALPPWVQEGGVETTLARLRDPGTRNGLREWFANPRIPLESVRLGYVANPADRRHEGRTLEDAAGESLELIPQLRGDGNRAAAVEQAQRLLEHIRRAREGGIPAEDLAVATSRARRLLEHGAPSSVK